MMAKRPQVVIIGGGFGGLNAAKSLARAEVDVVLIDRRNHHLFQPLLYQVATGALNASDIAYPLRSVLRKQKNTRVLLADVVRVDPDAQLVELDGGTICYDYLIIATGATHSYFGHDDWSEHAPGLKSIEDALDIRTRIYTAYEAAEREPDPELTREWLTFVVVGAGPTGVELAGALAEIGVHTLAEDFRDIDPTAVRVVLVEGLDRVLPSYPESLSSHARDALQQRGVEVMTDAFVTEIDERGVSIGDRRIPARTVLWAAGVQASPLARSLGVPLDRAGRVIVEPDLSVPGHPQIFVIGDLAHVEQAGTMVPGMAQGAIQGGKHAAENVERLVEGHDTLAFRYRDKGSMATIGRSSAVVDAGRLRFGGFLAWVFWWVVHITFLVGFRNRLMVIFGWAWSYLTFQRGARLITGDHGPLPALGPTAPPPASSSSPS
ncbi:MAG TPA: NAD(P)/FAD-dependent oxidoreductase [Kofleriaceae bacterium]|nr:NAD(P)/FAD-dependent oxidoreductase [Kofleriaceae bacterium]